MPVTTMISGAMIVRNAVATVRAALESLRMMCDEVVVLDTGSTDGTIDVLQETQRAWDEDGEGPKLRIYEWAWRDDFSAARNEAASHCESDWIVVLDADEILVPGNLRASILASPDDVDAAVAMLVAEGDHGAVDRAWQRRAYRKSRARWVYPVHNQLVGTRKTARTTAEVRTSYRGDLQRRLDRSVPMLLRFCENNPTDIHGPLMLAFTFAAVDRWADALEWSDRAIALGTDSPDEARCWLIRAQAIFWIRGLSAGEAALAEAIAMHPDSPDLRYLAVTMAFARWGEVAKRAERDGRYALTTLRPLPATEEGRVRMQAALDALDLRVELFDGTQLDKSGGSA